MASIIGRSVTTCGLNKRTQGTLAHAGSDRPSPCGKHTVKVGVWRSKNRAHPFQVLLCSGLQAFFQ
jgi:hypothetical protein